MCGPLCDAEEYYRSYNTIEEFVLQANLGRCKAAHDMTWAAALKEKIDIMVISEPNKKMCST